MIEPKPIISFSDFEKLDIRIGTIVAAKELSNSPKLIRLEIDFGSFKRQLLAGVKGMYTISELVGKQIPVIVNLAPRQMAGLSSEGMILAADQNNAAVLLFPEKKVDNGSMVR